MNHEFWYNVNYRVNLFSNWKTGNLNPPPSSNSIGTPAMVQRQPTMSTLTSIPPGTYDVRPQRGFSSTLMESIALSKAKFEAWVQHEKAKIVKESEEYAKQLAIEQSTVDSKAANLLALQLERGLKVSEEGDGKDSAESIAARKKSLEDQRLALQSDIEKLQGERDTREKRVSGENPQTWFKVYWNQHQLILCVL